MTESQPTYEARLRVYAPEGLTDDQLRAWGDAMDEAGDVVARALETWGSGDFHIESHGPDRVSA